jgi:Ran GTPase-activating protein (RanGAP) involved in mRNA processing and transport
VELTKRKLIDDDMEIVVTQAIMNKKCTKLRLGWNRITSSGASSLADALLNNNTMEELSLWRNCMLDLGIQFLAETLSINKSTLKKLDLSENGITDIGAAHLAEMLKTNRILTHLSLCKNELTDRGVLLLSNALQNRNHTLEVLSLSENKLLSDSSVAALIDMIKNNCSLTKLWLNDCNLSKKSQDDLRKVATSKKNFKVYV